MTLVQMIALRDEYRAAVSKVLKNQSYTIAETTYTFANLKWLQDEFNRLDKAVHAASSSSGGTMKVKRVIFRDD